MKGPSRPSESAVSVQKTVDPVRLGLGSGLEKYLLREFVRESVASQDVWRDERIPTVVVGALEELLSSEHIIEAIRKGEFAISDT